MSSELRAIQYWHAAPLNSGTIMKKWPLLQALFEDLIQKLVKAADIVPLTSLIWIMLLKR